MEDRLLVAKALVSCYAHLDDVCEALDKSAEKLALEGFYAIYPNDQMKIYERLIGIKERKRVLYNMKFIIEKGFHDIKKESSVLLRDRYEKGKGRNELTKHMGISLRTLYRRLDRALEDFTVALERIGFNKKKTITEFGNEPLFSVSLNRVIKEDDEAKEMREKMKSIKGDPFEKKFMARVVTYRAVSEGGYARKEGCV